MGAFARNHFCFWIDAVFIGLLRTGARGDIVCDRHGSHGGGGLGQSQTAIAKLVPDANMAEGLVINYSGGSGMPDDVAAWLDANGIERQ